MTTFVLSLFQRIKELLTIISIKGKQQKVSKKARKMTNTHVFIFTFTSFLFTVK